MMFLEICESFSNIHKLMNEYSHHEKMTKPYIEINDLCFSRIWDAETC